MLVAVVILLVFGSVGIILWIGGHDVVAGRISAGQLSAFVFYAVLVASAAGAISEVMGDLQRAAGATELLFELLEIEPTIRAPVNGFDAPNSLRSAIRPGISVSAMSISRRPKSARLMSAIT